MKLKSKSTLKYVVIASVFATTLGAYASSRRPSDAAIAFAQRTSDLMTNTVVAALLQEIGETTPENVGEGSLSIGLIFNDDNRDMRLVGTLDPLSNNDYPLDAFERAALDKALDGGQAYTDVQRVQGKWFYRRSVPLSVFQPQCITCHASFAGLGATDWVGALMLRVPVRETH